MMVSSIMVQGMKIATRPLLCVKKGSRKGKRLSIPVFPFFCEFPAEVQGS